MKLLQSTYHVNLSHYTVLQLCYNLINQSSVTLEEWSSDFIDVLINQLLSIGSDTVEQSLQVIVQYINMQPI